MPLLNANKRALSEENKGEAALTSKRSRTESKNRELDESESCATMTEPQKKANFSAPVSYTHLTLPTNHRV